MLLIIVMATVIAIGLTAIALAEPRQRQRQQVVVWNDETERRLLYDRKLHAGWW